MAGYSKNTDRKHDVRTVTAVGLLPACPLAMVLEDGSLSLCEVQSCSVPVVLCSIAVVVNVAALAVTETQIWKQLKRLFGHK